MESSLDGENLVNCTKLEKFNGHVQKEQQVSTHDGELLANLLRDYASAIRDYQFIRERKGLRETETRNRNMLLGQFSQSEDNFRTPSLSHYAYLYRDTDTKINPFRLAFMRYLPSRLSWSDEERSQRERDYADGKPPKEVSKFVDGSVRLIIALIGGLSLGVPMVIMAMQPLGSNRIVISSPFVLFFALVLSFGVRASNVETLVCTFTYAAVLVVYVGQTWDDWLPA
ncbi:hypothetical protein GGR54DRAFT_653987 [Hypoxylon sp. NC1633]|nr:hypothetical protein GGR54DRAFT_653987 [Hypoxylon sp. NC1633]